MSLRDLDKQLNSLQVLVWLQRSASLVLRAIWLGIGAIFAICWGLHELGGWLPDKKTWLLIGLICALIPCVGIPFSFPRRSGFVWSLDRCLGLKEQISTAWQEAISNPTNAMSNLLIADALEILPKSRKRILRRGWSVGQDLVSLLLVAILATCAFANYKMVIPIIYETPIQLAHLPPLGQEPRAEQILANDLPGMLSQAKADSTTGSTSPITSSDYENVSNALKEMGKMLSNQQETSDLGNALQNMDLQNAAKAMEGLAGKVDSLPSQVRENMGQAMGQTASKLNNTDQNNLSTDLNDASRELQNNNGSYQRKSRADTMDQVVSDLRKLDQEIKSNTKPGSGAGLESADRQQGKPTSMTRLGGSGQVVELPVGDLKDNQKALLNPGTPNQVAPTGTSGSLSENSSQSGKIVDNVIIPYSFNWQWRNVVTQYFQPNY